MQITRDLATKYVICTRDILVSEQKPATPQAIQRYLERDMGYTFPLDFVASVMDTGVTMAWDRGERQYVISAPG